MAMVAEQKKEGRMLKEVVSLKVRVPSQSVIGPFKKGFLFLAGDRYPSPSLGILSARSYLLPLPSPPRTAVWVWRRFATLGSALGRLSMTLAGSWLFLEAPLGFLALQLHRRLMVGRMRGGRGFGGQPSSSAILSGLVVRRAGFRRFPSSLAEGTFCRNPLFS